MFFSGGPLVCMSSLGNYPELYGIVSFGVGCALPGNPGVYTNVARFREWIKSAVEQVSIVDVPDSKCFLPQHVYIAAFFFKPTSGPFFKSAGAAKRGPAPTKRGVYPHHKAKGR